jgi:ATP-dependent helicase/nuclease subunit A
MTERLPADQSARDRIVRELDRNLIVEAGAGSGKTQKLADRMAAGIATGVYQLDGLVAVTFTRKAAAELRGRFQLALERELAGTIAANDSDREARVDRLSAALANLERFFAGTIHAFCARLLRERPVESGVSPGFTELDDVEERLLRERSWRDYREQAAAAGDADLLELNTAGVTAKQLDKAFEIVCLYSDVDFPADDASPPDTAQTWTSLAAFWDALRVMLPDPPPPGTTCDTQKRAGRFAHEWRAYLRGRRDPALLADLLRIWESKPSVTQKHWPDKSVAKDAQTRHALFRDETVLPYLAAWREFLYGRCLALLMKARESARRERLRQNALGFNDLLIMAADVLRRDPDVRRALQAKYRWLLVDEFQDTDPLQAEIMFWLAADESSMSERDGRGAESDWRRVPLRPGALFVVGDPKQSIYRFRRADIDIYNDVRARLAGEDEAGLVRLTSNFRSVPSLCAFVNDVFKTRFPAAASSYAPAFAPLDAYRTASDAPAVLALDLPSTLTPDQVASAEATRIAHYVRAEVDAGRRRCGDFLVLTLRKRDLRTYTRALEQLGVPVEVTGAGAFDASEEVRELALLLVALTDPQDAVALVGVLRGRLFGLSDRELFAFRQAGGFFSVFAELDVDTTKDAGAARVGRALASLREWFAWTRMLPAGAALDRILDDSGYLALAASSTSGAEAGDLLHAVDRVRTVVGAGFTLADAAASLAGWCGLDDDGQEDSTEVDSQPLEPGRPDVVRVMNLHKAKGLEATVVFLADPLGGFAPRVDVRIVRDGHAPDREGDAAVSGAKGYFEIVEDRGGYAKRVIAAPKNWGVHEAEELNYRQAEMDRLMYVAATRAREMLVVGRCTGAIGSKKGAWTALTAAMADAPALAVPENVTAATSEPVDLSPAAAAVARAAAERAHDIARRPSWAATSVTAETKHLPRLSVEGADALDAADPTRAVLQDRPSHRADAGLAWGTLIHGLLEHAMRHPGATTDDLRRLALWLTIDDRHLRPVVDRAVATVEALAASDFWRRAQSAPEHHVEVPFAVVDRAGAVPEVLSGAIDLVCRADATSWDIVDYKTDVSVDDVALAARYQAQVDAYAAAWTRIAGAPARSTIVHVRQEESRDDAG